MTTRTCVWAGRTAYDPDQPRDARGRWAPYGEDFRGYVEERARSRSRSHPREDAEDGDAASPDELMDEELYGPEARVAPNGARVADLAIIGRATSRLFDRLHARSRREQRGGKELLSQSVGGDARRVAVQGGVLNKERMMPKQERRAARDGGEAARRVAHLEQLYPNLEAVERALSGTQVGGALTEILDYVEGRRDEMTTRVLSSAAGRRFTEEQLDAMDFRTLQSVTDALGDNSEDDAIGRRRAARRGFRRAASSRDCGCGDAGSRRAASGRGRDDVEDDVYYGGRAGGERRSASEGVSDAPDAPEVFPEKGEREPGVVARR